MLGGEKGERRGKKVGNTNRKDSQRNSTGIVERTVLSNIAKKICIWALGVKGTNAS